jgi:hypothetical protein
MQERAEGTRTRQQGFWNRPAPSRGNAAEEKDTRLVSIKACFTYRSSEIECHTQLDYATLSTAPCDLED